MISSLSGTVGSVGSAGVEIDVGGVGYFVLAPTPVLAALRTGKRSKLFTQLVVREDSMTLYGFSAPDQREAFNVLMTVTGVGPKLALAVLSAFAPEALGRIVASGDAEALTTVPGVGKRGAQRMILELKERFSSALEAAGVQGTKRTEVRDALAGLGYSPQELREALDRLPDEDAPVEEMVKAALKELSKI